MAINDKHGKPSDELDLDFDDFNFDDLDSLGEEEGDPRSPKAKLKKFGSALKEEALSPAARRQYLHDALPQNYHTTLNAAESISDAASDLYNDTVMKEWEKSRGIVKRVIRADGDKLRRYKLGRLVDWAEQKDETYKSDYNAEEAEVQRQMGTFSGDIKAAMNGGNLSPQERRAFLSAQRSEDHVDEEKEKAEQVYQETTVQQQTATVGILNRILELQQRRVDYQEQIDFNYKKRQIEFGIRSLIGQRKSLEQTALMRAELKEGLAAITKNTGLPDYVKITSQENAKRLLRDKMVNSASDWAGSKLSGTMRSFMNQTKQNLATMGMTFRDGAEAYVDGKEMLDGAGVGFDDLLASMGADFLRKQASKRGGKYIRKFIAKNPKYTTGLDFTEAILANAGTYANMAMSGRSGFSKFDNFLDKNGYSGLAQQQRYRLQDSNANKQDQVAFMDRRLKTTFLDAYPAWFSKIWKSIEGIRTSQDPDKIDNFHYDFKFNRLRKQSDLQKEFDNETVDDTRVKNYNDGIDNWINKLDPRGTFTNEARSTIRNWLISNHSAGRESFPVALFRGEGLPKGTSGKVRQELEEKVPLLAGFDPFGVSMIMEEGVGLELKALRQNPEYRRMSKALGYADNQARSRHPVDNRKLAAMTDRYGANFAVDSGLAKYDREGNVSVDNDNIVRMVTGGGNRRYEQRANMDYDGSIEAIEGVDQRAVPEDSNRVPFRRMGHGQGRQQYDQWASAALANINGNRLRGFASGGFTAGKPDRVSGLTHGDEAVIDSTGTNNNRKLLSGIMKLGAPVTKNGKINRTYYRYLGFKSPEQVDKINELADLDVDELKTKATDLGNRVVKETKTGIQKARDRIKEFRSNQLHSDGYLRNVGPTPDFIGPVRRGGLRNKAQEISDLMHDPEELVRRVKLKDRIRGARDYAKNFDHRDLKETAEDYSRRAREAVNKANNSKSIDFDKTKIAIDKAIKKGKLDGEKPISLFLAGQNSPFITKGDFAVGRFRNRTSGSIITRPADIMDDIVLVDERGDYVTIATMVDMLEGVFDSFGKPVKLAGLDEGYRKYIKRTTQMAAAIKNTAVGRFVLDLKQKIWDDQPVDVCIVVNGDLVVALKASGFMIGQYLDAETGEVLKSHHDIQGVVKNQQGETVLTLDELSNGIFDMEGKRLKISKLKHFRNRMVSKIENFAQKKFKQIRNKVLNKALSFLEKEQSKDVYVMRWSGKSRELTKAFSMQDLDDGNLIDVRTGKEIKALKDIEGPIYSKVTKSVVVKEDELKHGFFNEDGTPYKDFKNMSLGDRVGLQKDRFTNKAKSIGSNIVKAFKEGYKGKGKASAETPDNMVDGSEACDVYIIENGDMQLKLTKQGFLDHDYRDTIGNIIFTPDKLLSSVFTSAGRIALTTEQITNGVYNEQGVRINTARQQAGPAKQRTKDKIPGMMSRLKNLLGTNKDRATVDGSEPIDVYIFHEGKLKKLMNASNFTMGTYSDADGKTIKNPAEINGAVYNSKGDVVLTEEELRAGIFTASAKVIGTKFYKKNGVPGGEGFRNKIGRLGRKFGSGIKNKLGELREGSWQWMKAKREEAARNKKSDVIVNVENKDKKEKGFIGRLLMGLGTMFGGMFTTMMAKFGRMFKSIRNAVMLSKAAQAAGGVLGGAGGGGGRGKLGLMTKLAGGALAAGGVYGAYNAMNNAGEEFAEDDPEMIAQEPTDGDSPGMLSSAWNGVNDATGGLAGEIATTAALGYGASKIGDMRRRRRLNIARPGLASRFGSDAGRVAGAAGNALGRGVGDAGRVAGAGGRVAGALGRFAGRRAGMVGRIAGGLASGASKAAGWALSPRAAVGRLGNVAKIGSMALKAGKFALGAARILSGPVGWGLMAATWIGGKLWDRYKSAKNPLMRFRFAQYGFDFDDEATTTKLLDLENMMKGYVGVNGEGKPFIKENVPEDQIFQLFEINAEDPKQQEHVQRFVAWWIKRFKPVYLSYVKQTHLLLKKFDISQIDDELNKTDKLTLLKGVNFTNKQNNPYLVSASPFADPAETPLTVDDVEKAYIKALKYINDMPDDKKTVALAEDGKPVAKDEEKKEGSGFSWLDNTKSAISDMANETLKVTGILASKTDELFGGWFSKASSNIKGLWGGLEGWLTSATDRLSAKFSEIWKSLSDQASKIMDKVAGGSAIGDAAVGMVEGATDAVGGAWDSAKNALGFESNLGDGEKHILAAARESGITNPTEIAALLATTAHESGNFRHTEENLRYSASALRKTWPNRFGDAGYAEKVAKGGPQAVANAVYGGRMGNDQPGDGWKYRGRGFIQLTGKSNYAQFAKDTGIDALRNPDLVARPDIGAKAAVWFWKKNGKISQYAQRGDITGVTKIVNGGTNGLPDRKTKFQKYLSKLQGGELNVNAAAPAVVAKTAPASSGGGSASTPASTQTPQKASTTLPPTIARPTSNSGTPANTGTGFVPLNVANTKVMKELGVVNAKGLPEPNLTDGQKAKANDGSRGGTSQPVNGKNPPWMDIAIQELNRGVGENKDLARANQYFADLGYPNYQANKQSWCAAFVSWCLKQSGTAYNQQNPLAAKGGYGSWGKKLSADNIPYGAIVVVAPSHAFFAAGVENGRVKGLGGNQGKPGEVKYSNFPISSIISVAWPVGASITSTGQAKSTTLATNNPVQVQQAAARQNASAQANEANAQRLPEPVIRSNKSAASYQQATANSEATAAANMQDEQVRKEHLAEAKTQTGLLRDILTAVSGQRTDYNTVGGETNAALGGMGKAQQAQVELIAAGINSMVGAVKEMRNSNKANQSLASQFPVGASK